MGAHSAKTSKRSTMVVETHTQYINEVKENEEVDIILTFFDHDKKRLHLKLEMIEKKSNKLSASMEWISLYIDLNIRKVTEFEKDKIQLMDDFIYKNKDNFDYQNLRFASKLKK
jgi:acyl-CoA thioester hydrolase